MRTPTPEEGARLQASMEMMQAVTRLASVISLEDACAVLEEIERTETLLPIFDPTAYRQVMGNIPGHYRLVKAFVAFRSELDAIVAAENY